MSLRKLYQSLPVQARQCAWCSEPILRNIDQDKDLRLYHHGCLLTARETFYECLECFAHFDGTEAHFEDDSTVEGNDWSHRRKVFCPHCGVQVQSRRETGVIEV